MIQKLSKNLRSIYDYEVGLGNEVLRVDEPAGSNCPLAVVFEQPLHFTEIAANLVLPAAVERWENRDTHYSLEAGFVCRESRHSMWYSAEYHNDSGHRSIARWSISSGARYCFIRGSAIGLVIKRLCTPGA